MEPRSEPTPPSAKRPERPPAELAKESPPGRVLIVEDEMELAEVLEFNLRGNGFFASVAHDGLSACRLIGGERPELILLDLMLPDLDGWEVCRMVRSHPDPEMAQIPIIMLTAMGTQEDRVRGIESGADLYLSKPYSVKEVLLHARQIIARRRRQQQMEQELRQMRAMINEEKSWQQILFHELRNQLLVISGYSFHLDVQGREISSQASKEYLQAINRSTNYLNNLAEEFILIRRVETEHYQLPKAPVAPRWLVEEIIELFRPHAKDLGKTLQLHSGTVAPQQVNAVGIKLILSNLLENAIKYSDKGHLIDVYLHMTETGLEIRVENDGPGIAEDDLEYIFGKFYRSAKPTNDHTGTGLGLYTARTLSHAMGGEIRAYNRPAGGVCFVVSLPG